MAIKESNTVRLFDRWAHTYDEDVSSSAWGFESYDDALEWISRKVASDSRVSRVIDLGSGTGVLAARLHQSSPAVDYLGIDSSAQMIAVAKRRSPTSVFVQADMRDYDMWLRYLDPLHNCIVISSYALHHISDKEKVELFNRVLTSQRGFAVQLVVVDYAFLDESERYVRLMEQEALGNSQVAEEILSEHYADLCVLRGSLSLLDIDVSYERNGIWDWRITARHAQTSVGADGHACMSAQR